MCLAAPQGGRYRLGAARRRLMNTPEQSQLGKPSAYIDQYDASLLFPIPRAGKRIEIGIDGAAPFFGADMWTAFELSWLNTRGKPQQLQQHTICQCR
jgi:7-cyano-7-deazaguanine reductase